VPIHDQGYRRYAGQRAPHGRAWAVIAAAGIRMFARKRAFVALLMLAWLPFLVRAVQIYAAANLPQVAFLAPTRQTFRDFLGQQQLFVFFIAVYVGSGLIANDRRANALQIYLARPLSRMEYVVGKLTILMAFLLLITWAPAVGLLVVQLLFSGSVAFLAANADLFPVITVAALLETLTVSAAMLALSSLSRNSRYVGVLYAGVIFFSEALYGVLFAFTRDSSWSWLSLTANTTQVVTALFGMEPRYDTPWPISLLIAAGLILLSAWILHRRVRGVEVVA
jgi:ABC-2 type transport system permease protein